MEIKKLLRSLGFLRFEHSNAKIEKTIDICKKIFWFCCSPFLFLPSLWFFLFRADTFHEKSFSIIVSVMFFFLTIAYYILTWKRKQIFELFTQFESKISKRNANKTIRKYKNTEYVMFASL